MIRNFINSAAIALGVYVAVFVLAFGLILVANKAGVIDKFIALILAIAAFNGALIPAVWMGTKAFKAGLSRRPVDSPHN